MKQIILTLVLILLINCTNKNYRFNCEKYSVAKAKVIYNSKIKLFEYTGFELGEYGFNVEFLECYYNDKNEY